MTVLHTERLVLRPWRDSDLDPWAAMNADPEVREHLGDPLTREQSEASLVRFRAAFDRRGYGWWAVEVRATGEFIGFAGMDDVDDGMPFTGVEIGWRLARASWGWVTPPRPLGRSWPTASTRWGSPSSSP